MAVNYSSLLVTFCASSMELGEHMCLKATIQEGVTITPIVGEGDLRFGRLNFLMPSHSFGTDQSPSLTDLGAHMLGGDEEHGSRDAVTLNMIGTRIHITNYLTRVLPLGLNLMPPKALLEKAEQRGADRTRQVVPWVLRNGVSTKPSFKAFSRKRPHPNQH